MSICLFIDEADDAPLKVSFLEDGAVCLKFGVVEGVNIDRGDVEVYMRRDQAEAIAEALAVAFVEDANMRRDQAVTNAEALAEALADKDGKGS